MDSHPIRLLLVDDHDLVRKTLRRILESHPEFEIIGEAADGAQAIAQTELLKPDVVLLDLSMPRMGGLEAAQHIQKRVPEAAIIILSIHVGPTHVAEAKALGIHAYVSKTKSTALVEAIHAVIRGEDFYAVE